MLQCQIANAPIRQADNTVVPSSACKLIGQHELDVIPGTRRGSAASRSEGMVGGRNRNDRNAPDLKQLQTRVVDMDGAAYADPGIAFADNPFHAFEWLHR